MQIHIFAEAPTLSNKVSSMDWQISTKTGARKGTGTTSAGSYSFDMLETEVADENNVTEIKVFVDDVAYADTSGESRDPHYHWRTIEFSLAIKGALPAEIEKAREDWIPGHRNDIRNLIAMTADGAATLYY